MFDEALTERACGVDRLARRVQIGDVPVASLELALRFLRSSVTARQQNRGAAMIDPNGSLWEEKLYALECMAKKAKSEVAIDSVCQNVIRSLSAVTGVELQETFV